MSYFGFGSATKSPEGSPKTKDTIRALPAAWYTSREMYELERRAVFSRRWLFITHSSRIKRPGDFLRYTVADFDFVIIMDRQKNINAFHNVCRHRAYQVVEESSGTKNILACRYHGWSYGLNGKLAKAPDYQNLTSFEKEKNGLYPVHVHIDRTGFIWVNMDAGEKPEVPWEQEFDQVDNQARFSRFNFDDYELDHTYGEHLKILGSSFY